MQAPLIKHSPFSSACHYLRAGKQPHEADAVRLKNLLVLFPGVRVSEHMSESRNFSVFLRRGSVPARPAVRSLVADPLAPAAGGGADRRAVARKPLGGASNWGDRDQRSRVGFVDTAVQEKAI